MKDPIHGIPITSQIHMPRIKDIIDIFEGPAPFNSQEDYDNSGLIIGDPRREISKILLCIDSTEEVVNEALENSCELIVAHHPIVFKGLKRFNSGNYIEKTVEKAIKSDISILAIHTNLDNSLLGVNKIIAEKIGLQKPRILKPKNMDMNLGAGMIGDLPEPQSSETFLNKIREVFKSRALRHTEILKEKVQKIALCGGAGSFLLEEAKAQDADVFLSGDFKYHEFFDADGQVLIIDPGHFESERFTVELFKQIISGKFPNIALQFSVVKTNPIHYFF
jgi:dinuclear metal center YbgI/SA1388 family protein